jgi:hypothetical protein
MRLRPSSQVRMSVRTRSRDAVPAQAWQLIKTIRSAVENSSDAAVVLTGSLGGGGGDAVSDIDFDVWCDSPGARERVVRQLDQLLRDSGRFLSQFPATHIGLPDLWVNFVEVNGVLLKVDLHYRLRHPGVRGADSVSGGVGFVHPASSSVDGLAQADTLALAGIHSKFSGWLWYTHTKIVRGEYWEADDSLGVMRTRALLPLLLFVRGLPLEGCRRLETRLTREDQQQLKRTRSHGLGARSLRSALVHMADLFETFVPVAIARLGHDFRKADLGRIRELAQI